MSLLRNSEQLAHTSCRLLADFLIKNRMMLATAESCTGGLIAATCTSLAGSSRWFERGVVTYSNAAKTDLLSVDTQLLARHGAVSEEVARAMAVGLLRHAPVQAAMSVTGIAGPGGASADKPVGTVWFGWAWNAPSGSGHHTEVMQFAGDRVEVRSATVAHSLQRLVQLLAPESPTIPPRKK